MENTTIEEQSQTGAIDATQVIQNEDAAIQSMLESSQNQTNEDVQDVTIENTTESGSGIDISTLDLSDLTEHQASTDETAITQETPSNNGDVSQVLDMLSQMQNNQTPSRQEEAIPADERAGLELLVQNLQKANLLPQGLSEEDRTLLQEAKQIRDDLTNKQQQETLIKEHHQKINDLDSFSKSLEELIPGYNNEFMAKVVSDIQQTNPDAVQAILDNPTKLVGLWSKIGAKAQPSKEPTNVISGNNQQGANINSLAEKVRNGTATEDEEARFLFGAN